MLDMALWIGVACLGFWAIQFIAAPATMLVRVLRARPDEDTLGLTTIWRQPIAANDDMPLLRSDAPARAYRRAA